MIYNGRVQSLFNARRGGREGKGEGKQGMAGKSFVANGVHP